MMLAVSFSVPMQMESDAFVILCICDFFLLKTEDAFLRGSQVWQNHITQTSD